MALLQKAYLGSTALFRNTSWFEDDPYTLVNESSTVTVTANTAAHTKGSWAQLVASTSSNASLIVIEATAFTNNVDTSTLLDIGTGASGSETAIISNVAIGGAATTQNGAQFVFAVPIQIARGTRISARIQSLVTGGKTATIKIYLIDTADYSQAPTSVDVLGTNTSTSVGALMSGAAGTWVQVISSTTRAYRAVVVVPSVNSAAAPQTTMTYQLGTGASGSETEAGRIMFDSSNAEFVAIKPSFPTLISRNIASGTRLSIRHTGVSFDPQRFAVTLIGIP